MIIVLAERAQISKKWFVKLRQIIEINLLADRLDIHAKEENTDMHAAIDIVIDKVKKQLVRSKERIQEHRP